jgi:WD40 repeat protein
VRIWDVASGRQRSKLTGHIGRALALSIAPDGAWLASGGYDGTVRIWDVTSGQQRGELTAGRVEPVLATAIAPDGKWLASASRDETVRIWDIRAGKPAAMTRVAGRPLACLWELRDDHLVVGGHGGLYRFALRPAVR